MPFSRPTRDELIARVVADVEAELQNGASRIRRTVERAFAVANGGLAHTQHGHLEWSSRQLIPSLADEEYLVLWADIFLGDNSRKAASKSEFTITVTGTVANAPIPSGTTWVRVDGVRFESYSAYALPSVAPLSVSVTIRAIEPGVDGNTVPGTVLTLESGVPDIVATATVEGSGSSPIGGGADIERKEDLLARLLEHLQSEPKAGAKGDYIRWAKEISGVTRAWELPGQLGPSTVVVPFVLDTFDEDGFFVSTTFPDSTLAQTVTDYLSDLANVTAIVTAQAPNEITLDPSIQISPNTVEVQAQVTAQLHDLLLRQNGPDTSGSTVYLWQIIQAISLAPGLTNHVLVSPVADITLGVTDLLTLGTPTFAAIP